MNSHTLEQYRLARCPQIVGDDKTKGNPILMSWFVRETSGRVCTTNCAWYEKGNCSAYKFLISGKPFSDINPICSEPVRAEAARLGLSIGEVRRRRNGG